MITEKQREIKAIAGVSTEGEVIDFPLSHMANVMIAGTTCTGKSKFIHSLLMSILTTSKKNEVKFLIGDPKRTDYKMFVDMPFMLENPIADSKDILEAMKQMIQETERRFSLYNEYGGFKNLDEYNEAIERGDIEADKLPHIVFVIDEIAYLLSHEEEAEEVMERLAIKCRAFGIHLIFSTQSPTREILGKMRMVADTIFAFNLPKTSSQIALGEVGAEYLTRPGEFYFSSSSEMMQRGQAPFIEDEEMEKIFNYLTNDINPKANIFKKLFVNKKDDNVIQEVNDKTLFPLTLFNSREKIIKERSGLAKGLSKKIEKQTSETMLKYDGVELVESYVANSVITLKYDYKSKGKKIPNLDSVEERLREVLNESATVVRISVGYVQVLVPLPMEYRIPIDVKTMIDEVL